jgi:hypothetical protein
MIISSSTIKLHPLIWIIKTPEDFKWIIGDFLPKSWVAIKEQEFKLAVNYIDAAGFSQEYRLPSVSRTSMCIQEGHSNTPCPREYACESSSVIPFWMNGITPKPAQLLVQFLSNHFFACLSFRQFPLWSCFVTECFDVSTADEKRTKTPTTFFVT